MIKDFENRHYKMYMETESHKCIMLCKNRYDTLYTDVDTNRRIMLVNSNFNKWAMNLAFSKNKTTYVNYKGVRLYANRPLSKICL